MTVRAFRGIGGGLIRVFRSNSGVSLVEFGLCLPLLAMIIMGGLECINLVLANQKIERIASTTADTIARNTLAPNEQSFHDTFTAVDRIAQPFTVMPRGRIIMTGVIGTNQGGNVVNKVTWQRCGGTRTDFTSGVGAEWTATSDYGDGPNIVLPNGIQLLQNQMVVISEIVYEYESLISLRQMGLGPTDGLLRQRSVFVTRGQAFPFITPSAGVTPARCTTS